LSATRREGFVTGSRRGARASTPSGQPARRGAAREPEHSDEGVLTAGSGRLLRHHQRALLERVTNLRNLILPPGSSVKKYGAALLPDPSWDLVAPFLPTPFRSVTGGRPRVSDRAYLTGILFVVRSGIPWQMLPQEPGCGSEMTYCRCLRDRQLAGSGISSTSLHSIRSRDTAALSRAGSRGQLFYPAVYGGDWTGANPTDRARRGSKRHVICDRVRNDLPPVAAKKR
jgi:Putative transposase of IS4/5 family (DUF4096)